MNCNNTLVLTTSSPLQYVILVAALIFAAEAFPTRREGADVSNTILKTGQHFHWQSVDSGDKETHYKNFELMVRFTIQTIYSQAISNLCLDVSKERWCPEEMVLVCRLPWTRDACMCASSKRLISSTWTSTRRTSKSHSALPKEV